MAIEISDELMRRNDALYRDLAEFMASDKARSIPESVAVKINEHLNRVLPKE